MASHCLWPVISICAPSLLQITKRFMSVRSFSVGLKRKDIDGTEVDGKAETIIRKLEV